MTRGASFRPVAGTSRTDRFKSERKDGPAGEGRMIDWVEIGALAGIVAAIAAILALYIAILSLRRTGPQGGKTQIPLHAFSVIPL